MKCTAVTLYCCCWQANPCSSSRNSRYFIFGLVFTTFYIDSTESNSNCRYLRSRVPDISSIYLYCRHNPTTLQKNLHLNQKGVMNQLLASIWLMNDLRLIWIQSVSMCYYFCRSQSNEIYTKYGVKCKILPISHL